METLMELISSCSKAEGIYEKEKENIDRASNLEALGFHDMAQALFKKVELAVRLSKVVEYEYVKVTADKVKAYLKMKVERYDKEHKKDEKVVRGVSSVTFSTDNFTWTAGSSILSVGSNLAQYYPLYVQAADGTTIYQSATPPTQHRYHKEEFSECTCDFSAGKEGTIGKFIWTETPIDQYNAIPPTEALDTLKEHQKRNIFDYFTIASINAVRDPLLFGRIAGCQDRFFICQWGDDIQLDDVI